MLIASLSTDVESAVLLRFIPLFHQLIGQRVGRIPFDLLAIAFAEAAFMSIHGFLENSNPAARPGFSCLFKKQFAITHSFPLPFRHTASDKTMKSPIRIEGQIKERSLRDCKFKVIEG